MHRIVSLSLVALLVIFISCAAYAGQKEVIVALEAVKGSIESGVNQMELSKLLASAKVEINMAQRDRSVSKEFIDTAEECRAGYPLAFEFLKLQSRFIQFNNRSRAEKCDKNAREILNKCAKLLDKLYELAAK